mmetsp:Transcript_17575/g.42239  ORF Transcript_17575/g.42239 Transcript_17575/m.42239 type:complete len:205 (+) Transcript_17575:1815-2429(+)
MTSSPLTVAGLWLRIFSMSRNSPSGAVTAAAAAPFFLVVLVVALRVVFFLWPPLPPFFFLLPTGASDNTPASPPYAADAWADVADLRLRAALVGLASVSLSPSAGLVRECSAQRNSLVRMRPAPRKAVDEIVSKPCSRAHVTWNRVLHPSPAHSAVKPLLLLQKMHPSPSMGNSADSAVAGITKRPFVPCSNSRPLSVYNTHET